MWSVFPVFCYIKNTRFWRWMWSCHDFLAYRIRLLKPGYCSDTFLPACGVSWVVSVQGRSWNGESVIMYMQCASISTRWGFKLPSDQFFECFKSPRRTELMRLFLKKCLPIWNPFGPHYSRFLDRRLMLHMSVFLFSWTFMAKIAEGITHTPLNQCFKVSTESRGVKGEEHVHYVCKLD